MAISDTDPMRASDITDSLAVPSCLDFIHREDPANIRRRLKLMLLLNERLYVPMPFLLHNATMSRWHQLAEDDLQSLLASGAIIVGLPEGPQGQSFLEHRAISIATGHPYALAMQPQSEPYAQFLDSILRPEFTATCPSPAISLQRYRQLLATECTRAFTSPELKLRTDPTSEFLQAVDSFIDSEPFRLARQDLDGFSGVTRSQVLKLLDQPALLSHSVRNSAKLIRNAANQAYSLNVGLDLPSHYQAVNGAVATHGQAASSWPSISGIDDTEAEHLFRERAHVNDTFGINLDLLEDTPWDVLQRDFKKEDIAKHYFMCKRNLAEHPTDANWNMVVDAMVNYLLYLSEILPNGPGLRLRLRRFCRGNADREIASVLLAVTLNYGTKGIGLDEWITSVAPGSEIVVAESIECVVNYLTLRRLLAWLDSRAATRRSDFAKRIVLNRRPANA